MCVCVLVCCGVTDGQISRIRPRQETQAGPGERLSFSLEGERTSQGCRLCFTCLFLCLSCPPPPPRASPGAACATSLQHHTVVCNSLNCHYPSPPGVALNLKATRALKRGRVSVCGDLCDRVCAFASHLTSRVEGAWDAGLCCNSPDRCNTREPSSSARSTCPVAHKHMRVSLVHGHDE